jgi:hypothetical protein
VNIAPRVESALSPNIVDRILNAGIASQYRGAIHPTLLGAGAANFLAGDLVGINGGVIVESQQGTIGLSGLLQIGGIALEPSNAAAVTAAQAAFAAVFTGAIPVANAATWAAAQTAIAAAGVGTVYYNTVTCSALTTVLGDVWVTDKGIPVIVTAGTSSTTFYCMSLAPLPQTGTLSPASTLAAGVTAYAFTAVTANSSTGNLPMVEAINSNNEYRMMTYCTTPMATKAANLKLLVGRCCDLCNVMYQYPDGSIQTGTVVDINSRAHASVKIIRVPNDAAMLATHEFCPVIVKFLESSYAFSTLNTTGAPTGMSLQL